ncbi:MAG: HD domain-containing phosphohydrolase [Gemmatimonadota bacterium]
MSHDAATGGTRGRVLVVEDDPQNARLLSRLLTMDGFVVSAVHDGEAALSAVGAQPPDVILLDWMLPKVTGIDVCRQLKDDASTRLIPIVLITGLGAREHRLEGINAGADDFLTKPFDHEELKARIRALVRLKHATDELDSAESVIVSLALTVEARDSGTDGHCQRLAKYSMALGAACGMSNGEIAALSRGGYLHDVGKIGIPDSVLLKPGKLSREEYLLMQEHTVIGERLCGNLKSLAAVRPIVRHHHERLDGSGYPDGLKGSAVPVLAQIVSIADAFDAMTSLRPYRAPATLDHAFAELREDARCGRMDEALVSEFIRVIEAGALQPA